MEKATLAHVVVHREKSKTKQVGLLLRATRGLKRKPKRFNWRTKTAVKSMDFEKDAVWRSISNALRKVDAHNQGRVPEKSGLRKRTALNQWAVRGVAWRAQYITQ